MSHVEELAELRRGIADLKKKIDATDHATRFAEEIASLNRRATEIERAKTPPPKDAVEAFEVRYGPIDDHLI